MVRRLDKVLERSTLLVAGTWTLLWMLNLLIVNEATLSPDSVSENPCLTPDPEPMRPTIDFLLTMARHAKDPFYIPMGSQHMYRSYAEYLLGRPPRSQDELNRMNLRIQGSPTHTWITTGYDQRFIQQCIPAMAFFKGFCLAGLGSEQTNLSPIRKKTVINQGAGASGRVAGILWNLNHFPGRTMNTLVWTDNKTSALFTRCVLGHQNDWFVLSMKPSLDRETMKAVLKAVIKLGYNASYAARARYV